MIKFFRTIRKKLIEKENVRKYLLYAIGEILLVVIGILIALQVNNWNENRKMESYRFSLYERIKADLEMDTTQLTTFLKRYAQRDSELMAIINREITDQYFDTISQNNIKECEFCFSKITSYWPFNPQTRGYNQLKDYSASTKSEWLGTDEKIITFYNGILPYFNETRKKLGELTKENLLELSKYSWFADNNQGIYNPDAIAYFKSNTYRNDASAYQIFITKNYYNALKIYKTEAQELILELDKTLKGKKND